MTLLPVAGAEVVAVVPNWNRRELLLECLASLDAAESPPGGLAVIVVDNGSLDGSVEAVRARYAAADVVALPQNVGFAAATNIGLERALAAGARWTLLLNNDATVTEDMLGPLVAAGAEPSVGLVTPTITVHGHPERVFPAAGFRRRLTLAATDSTARPPGAGAYDVDWAIGCCLLVKADVWRSVGLLDEGYTVYFEDHDFCIRARGAGWRIRHVPSARAVHRGASSSGTGSPAQMYHLARSSVTYYWRHTTGAHRALIVLYRAGSLSATMVRTLASGRPRSAWAYLRGLGRGLADLHTRPPGEVRRASLAGPAGAAPELPADSRETRAPASA